MQTLFTSDRMIVDGEIRKSEEWASDGSVTLSTEYLYLKFIFQVNGKLTQHTFNTQLEENGTGLKDWSSWNAICELFFSMGYKFEEKLTPAWNMPTFWIKELKYSPDYIYRDE